MRERWECNLHYVRFRQFFQCAFQHFSKGTIFPGRSRSELCPWGVKQGRIFPEKCYPYDFASPPVIHRSRDFLNGNLRNGSTRLKILCKLRKRLQDQRSCTDICHTTFCHINSVLVTEPHTNRITIFDSIGTRLLHRRFHNFLDAITALIIYDLSCVFKKSVFPYLKCSI